MTANKETNQLGEEDSFPLFCSERSKSRLMVEVELKHIFIKYSYCLKPHKYAFKYDCREYSVVLKHRMVWGQSCYNNNNG